MGRAVNSDALVDRARAVTGLDDFGEGPWRDGLDVLCSSLSTEARMNDTGVAVTEARLENLLRERLRIEDWYRRHPEIAEERVEGPLVIIGLPRTGTSALSNLLAADPSTRSLRAWESGSPTPPPATATETTDARIARTQAGIEMLHDMLPVMRDMREDTAWTTAESNDLLGMSMRAHQFSGMAWVPSWDAWWLGLPELSGAYSYHRRVLRLLQWRCPPRRWHLKNPADIFFLEDVCAAYPDVRFVWTHRDPSTALVSVTSLIDTMYGLVTDHVDRAALGRHVVDLWAEGIERALAWRSAHGDDRFVDVAMRDLLEQPMHTVTRIYEGIGWPLTEAASQAFRLWIEQHGRGTHGRHTPVPSDYGLVSGGVRGRFANYLERFPEARA